MSNVDQGTRIYKVGSKEEGDDFDKLEIDILVYEIAEWFRSPECDRQYPDPVEAAKQKVKECLLGLTGAGKSWVDCPEEFDKRIKIKTQWDMIAKEGIPTSPIKSPRAQRKQDKEAEEKVKSIDVELNFNWDNYRTEKKKSILDQFPELNTPAHEPNVERLTLLYAQQEELMRLLTLQGTDFSKSKKKVLLDALDTVQKMVDSTMKGLGIHPDQLRKKFEGNQNKSIADFVAMVDDDSEFKKREKLWSLTLALQLYWMSLPHDVGPSVGRKPGPNLHHFEIWHMTRTRPMEFTCKCGEHYTLVDGFEPEELLDYLIKEGVLVEDSVLPKLFNDRDLKGMEEGIRNLTKEVDENGNRETGEESINQ